MFKSVRSSDEKVVITWKDLVFETVEKDPIRSSFFRPVYKKKTILNKLSGHAQSKELLAIMGPTGCGKTSLLNILAARVPSGGANMSSLSGTIQVNGKLRNEEQFRKISAYVLQDDHMYAHLTVFETLMLAAHFYLPDSVSDEEKIAHVDATIASLGLVKARDTIIGNDKVRGVSGGERRRASIAVQLLADPAVLFLDEPTSGLDAFQSLAVMDAMKKLAKDGRLVISVIHQPRSSIFDMFDKLLLLSEGNTMFYGDSKDSVAYFASKHYPCPGDFNPSDFFLDLLSPDNRSDESQALTEQRISKLAAEWTQRAEEVKLKADELQNAEDEFRSVKSIGAGNTLKKTWNNFLILCWRSWTEQRRNKAIMISKIISSVIFALIIGGIYSNTTNNQRGIQNRRGILFLMLVNQGFNSLSAVLNTFPVEKTIVNRERGNKAYSTLSYCIAKVFMETPLNLLPVAINCAILHPLANLNYDTFGYFILIAMFANFTCILLGLCISAIAPSIEAAGAIGPPFVIIGIIFGGFYIKVKSLPIILNWIPYISLFQWTFRGLATNEFKDTTFTCESSDTSKCLTTGEQVLVSLDFQGHTTNYAMFGLGMLMLCYLVGLYLLLIISGVKYSPVGFTGSKFLSITNSIKETANAQNQEKEFELGSLPQKSGAIVEGATA